MLISNATKGVIVSLRPERTSSYRHDLRSVSLSVIVAVYMEITSDIRGINSNKGKTRLTCNFAHLFKPV